MTLDPGDTGRPSGYQSGRPSGHPSGPTSPRHVSFQVERLTFRRRRLIDSMCALPLLGWILWWLPLIWYQAAEPVPASLVLIYIFGIWLGLALVAARLVQLMARSSAPENSLENSPGGGAGQ